VTYSKSDQQLEPTENIVLTADNITLDGHFEVKKEIFLYADFNVPDEKRLKRNDIFMCFSSGSKAHLGKVAFIENDTNYLAGGFMGIIRAKENILPKYLFQLLNSILRQSIRDLGAGSNINNLSSVINDIQIPLLPLEIQQKIVSEIEVLEKKEQEAKGKIKTFRNQIFSLLEKYSKGNVSDLCNVSNEKCNSHENPDKEFLYLGLEHIESNTGNYSNNFEQGHNILSTKNVFCKNDVLYGKLRPYLNKVVIAKNDGICSTDILVLKSKVPQILKYALLSEAFVKQTSDLMKGVSLPRIGINDFLTQKIPVPSLSEQQKIVTEIEKIEAQIAEEEKITEVIPAQKNEILKKHL
jgi:type I restriction enzyme M protein